METRTRNLDEKAAQPKIRKKAKSRSSRGIRIRQAELGVGNKKFCGECGFRTRGKNHCEGSHHATRLTAK